MRRQRFSRLHLLLIALLTVLVFSARLTRAQERPFASKAPTQLSNLAAHSVAVPEVTIRLHPAYESLSLNFGPNRGQTPSQVRLPSPDIDYHLRLTSYNALPEAWQLPKVDELSVKANHFIGNAPAQWLTDVSTDNKVHHRTPDPGGDVQYYGHRIRWAGRIILSIGEQARLHPRVTRVLELIEPQLCFEKRLPRASSGNIHVVGRVQLHQMWHGN